MSQVEAKNANPYLSWKMTALLGLGFASGLPSLDKLLGGTLQAWLIDCKYDLKQLGMIALLGNIFTFKFLAAPFLDRFQPPVFGGYGRRRGWLIWIQSGLILGIVMLGMLGPTGPEQGLMPMMIAALFVAAFAAMQDIVCDAYRTDVCEGREQGPGAAVYVNGYRIAMLAAGGGALLLADKHVPWNVIYFILAGLMGVGLLVTLFAPTPANDELGPVSLKAAVIDPFKDFFGTRAWLAAFGLLGFMVLFKLPDAMANQMVGPFLWGETGLGFTKTDVAVYREMLGLTFIVLGTFLGGWVVSRLGSWRSLWVFGVLQALSNVGWVVLGMCGKSKAVLTGVVIVESVCAGMVAAGFVAFLMSQCNRKFSATQYALFTSLIVFVSGNIAATSGVLAARMGFTAFFWLTVAVALPSLALLAFLRRETGEGQAAEEPVGGAQVSTQA